MTKDYLHKIDFDEIVDRIQEESSREGDRSISMAPEQPDNGPYNLKFAATKVGDDPLQELLAYHNEDFIRKSYLTILGREPDPGGFHHYFNLLAKGRATKIDIIGRLRYSDEGRKRKAVIRGLRLRFAQLQLYKIPILGYILHIIVAIIRLPDKLKHLRQLESLFHAEHKEMEKRLRMMVDERRRQNERQKQLNDQLKRDVRQQLNQRADQLDRKISTLKTGFTQQDQRLGRLLREVQRRLPEPLDHGQMQVFEREENLRLAQLYLSFEDKYRGSRTEIKNRLGHYLSYLEETDTDFDVYPVVDLGCGRGEWLELLGSKKINALGIDENHAMVTFCRDLGLNVVEEDIYRFLQMQPENTFGWITGFHIIEHFPLKGRLTLFDETLRALIPGGGVIFETPNPENLQISGCDFFRDPTHHHPIVPETVQFLLEYCGYHNVSLLRLNKRATPQYTRRNKYIDELLYKLNMEQDFAVIGYKPL